MDPWNDLHYTPDVYGPIRRAALVCLKQTSLNYRRTKTMQQLFLYFLLLFSRQVNYCMDDRTIDLDVKYSYFIDYDTSLRIHVYDTSKNKV